MVSIASSQKRLVKEWQGMRTLLRRKDGRAQGLQTFFQLHAAVHSRGVARSTGWSFEDALFEKLTPAEVRQVPVGGKHSVAWLIWHIARCEDVTMNLLIGGKEQVLEEGNWLERIRGGVRDTGNAMHPDEIKEFSERINIRALRGYRAAVGKRTRQIVRRLTPAALTRKPEPRRLRRIIAEGAVVAESLWLVRYWGGRTFAGLLLVPATGHPLYHLTEAWQQTRKRR